MGIPRAFGAPLDASPPEHDVVRQKLQVTVFRPENVPLRLYPGHLRCVFRSFGRGFRRDSNIFNHAWCYEAHRATRFRLRAFEVTNRGEVPSGIAKDEIASPPPRALVRVQPVDSRDHVAAYSIALRSRIGRIALGGNVDPVVQPILLTALEVAERHWIEADR